MRFGLCRFCVYLLQAIYGQQWYINPGIEEEEAIMKPPAAPAPTPLRRCANRKSRKNPDVQCPLNATHGDYCHMHHRNPFPFRIRSTSSSTNDIYSSATSEEAAAKIQKAWKQAAPLLRFCHQGPAANDLTLATNDKELYSLDSVSSIPQVYLFTFADSRRTLWAFDIRTLSHSMATGFPQQNPYTRELLPSDALAALYSRIEWLRARKYHILHLNTDVLTEEQLWNQRVLDVFLKIEALGYYASNRWFHSLSLLQHEALYRRLYQLWEWKLGLSQAQKEQIIPGHLAPGPAPHLFRFAPESIPLKEKSWWERTNLGLIEAFISRAVDRENRKLGAMYVLMGLVQVSREAALALPWVVESLP